MAGPETLGAACPVCGEWSPVWRGEPPTGCFDGGGRALCAMARTRAFCAAKRREVCPDAFDAEGNMQADQLGRVITAMAAAGLDPATGLPSRRSQLH